MTDIVMSVHFCDDGMPDGKAPCSCRIGRDHSMAECPICNDIETRESEGQGR